jgi:hypothetical protein
MKALEQQNGSAPHAGAAKSIHNWDAKQSNQITGGPWRRQFGYPTFIGLRRVQVSYKER